MPEFLRVLPLSYLKIGPNLNPLCTRDILITLQTLIQPPINNKRLVCCQSIQTRPIAILLRIDGIPQPDFCAGGGEAQPRDAFAEGVNRVEVLDAELMDRVPAFADGTGEVGGEVHPEVL
jgi:hypothetical protein